MHRHRIPSTDLRFQFSSGKSRPRRRGGRKERRQLAVQGSEFRCLAICGLLAAFGAAFPPPAGAIAIGDLHCNDAIGFPAEPNAIGTPVTVTGTLVVGTGVYTSVYTDLYLEDGTGAIEVYHPAVPDTFYFGDSLTVSGTIGQYNGNTEIVLQAWIKHGPAQRLPAPIPLTCAEVFYSFWPDSCEENESRLIRISDVTWSGTWPAPGSNGTVTLTDASGSCTMFLDRDTGTNLINPPVGAFDVIGILKQYSPSPPHQEGYQIVPRGPDDILLPGPRILVGPIETDLRPDQVTIIWTTDGPGTSQVDYGLTPSYELGTILNSNPETEHAVPIPGLLPATVYHYRVQTGDAEGLTLTGDRVFCTASGPESSGEITVLFNKTVDPSLALGSPAQGQVDLPARLIERINAAQHSIDVCQYSFDLASVADALIAAKNRGVVIRFAYENRPTYQAQVQRLIQNGIPVIDDAYGSNSGDGYMHNKFVVFDARGGSPDGADDWVWTGSLNLTAEGAYTDAQNVVLIQDQALAVSYTMEFNEMWGSSGDLPNAAESRFGSRKRDDTPKRFLIGGTPTELYFSPSDGILQAVIREIREADRSLHFCVLSFTREDVSLEMRSLWYNLPGFELRGVFDSAQGNDSYSEYSAMNGDGESAWDPPADVWLDAETGSLHHKYMVLDANRSGLAPTVLTGSPNWSGNAQTNNDENLLILESFALANHYFQEFARRYEAAGGSGDLTVAAPIVAADPPLRLRVTPNPVRGRASLRFDLPRSASGEIALYSPDGRRRAVLYRGAMAAGTQELRWSSEEHPSVPAGVHFLRMDLGGEVLSTRVLILP